MKRFLSIILALALVISMIPATFAAEEAELNPVYSFLSTAMTDSTITTIQGVTEETVLNTEVSSGKWFYVTMLGGAYKSTALGKDYMTISSSGTKPVNNNAFVFDIKVDKEGVYVPNIEYTEYQSGNVDFYLIKKSDFTGALTLVNIDAAVAESSYEADAKVKHVASIEMHAYAESKPKTFAEKLNLDAGNYYFIIKINQGSGEVTTARTFALIKNLSLTRQPWVKISSEANKVSTGKTIKVTGKAFNADDSDAGSVTYSVSPAMVASVAADGTVTGLAEGKATITAKATIGGVEYSNSVDVNVVAFSKDQEYVFSYQAAGYSARGAFSAEITYEKTAAAGISPKRWAYMGMVRNKAHNVEPDSFYAAAQPVRITQAGNGTTLKIEVTEDAYYKPVVPFIGHRYGGRMSIYIAPVSYATANEWDMTSVLNAGTNGTARLMNDYHTNAASQVKMLISEVDTYNENETATDEYDPANTGSGEGDVIWLTKGDYYITFAITSAREEIVLPDGGSYYIRPQGLKLIAQPYVTISADASEVNVGETAKVVGKAFKADDSDAGSVTYSVSPADVASVASDGTVTGLKAGTATITATATIGGVVYSDSVEITVKKIDKTHKFVFANKVMTDANIAAATELGIYKTKDKIFSTTRDKTTGAGTGEEFIDEYTDFDTSKGTDKWLYSRLGGFIYLFENYTQFYTYKLRYGNTSVGVSSTSSPAINTRFIFQVEVKYPGKYDITAETYNLTNGSEADVYIVKKSEVDGSPLLQNWGGYDRMTVAFLKSIPVDGRISNIGANKTTSTDYICTKELEKGDYYIILHTASDNPVSSGSSAIQLLALKSITLAESAGDIVSSDTPVATKSKVSFATDVNGNISTDSIARGETVELSAPETNSEGKVFKRWVKGADANGVCVSVKANDTYKVITNTYLTAVYGDAVEAGDKVVEFYNENGEYFTTVAAADGKAVLPTENPSLPGYTFEGWYVSEEDKLVEGAELKADVTRAVAKFTGKTVLTASNYNIIRVNGAALTDYDFGTLVSASDDKAKYWLRDGHIVKFGTTYDHYIWDSANIMSSYDATTAIRPTVVIDKYPVDGAYMVEYDKGNKAIAEVGILFGSSEKITVDSCSSKATSQWNKAHGQFAATPYGDEEYARGYLIYADGDSYKVIYTDAVAIQ